jgi:hypothetical protein
MKIQLLAKASLKTTYIVAASLTIVVMAAAFSIFNLVDPPMAVALASGDYRAKATGNWSSTSTWETYNGTSWVAAVSTPTNASGAIEIQSPFTVTIGTSVSADELTIDAGASIVINTGKTFTIQNGTGTDLTVDGSLTVNGNLVNSSSSISLNGTITVNSGASHTILGTVAINNGGYYDRKDNSVTTSAGIWTVNSGGTYAHNLNGDNIIQATWNSGSTCLVNGITSTKPGNLNQSFYDLTWNCQSQNTKLTLAGKITSITHDLTFISTGSSYTKLGEGENYTLDIGHNLECQGGTISLTTKSKSARTNVGNDFNISGGIVWGNDSTKDDGEGDPEMWITDDFNITSGTLNCSQYLFVGTSKGDLDIHVYGDYNQSGGTVTCTSSGGGEGEFYFCNTGSQNFIKTGGTLSSKVNFTVKTNSVTNLGSSIITGSGTFDLEADGEIQIGHANGITASSASGNIQVTGTRTFSTSGYYTYSGTGSQVTGDGMPTTVKNFTINNNSGVALTQKTSISGTFYLTTGVLTTPSDTIIVGTSTATIGTVSRTNGMVNGVVKRWFRNTTVSNVEFPMGVGGYYQPIFISYTGAPAGSGTIATTFTAIDPGKNGFNIIDAGDTLVNIGYGLWETNQGNGMNNGTFSLDITATALATVSDPTKLHLIRRTNSSSAWAASGTHVAGTGTSAVPIAHRTGLLTHGQWGIASGSTNPLPITLLSFTAKKNDRKVDLKWSTASEINNDYFLVERSSDGINFTELMMKDGAGNSTVTRNYFVEDLAPLNGINYYRLSQTDFNGVTSYSDIESVDFGAEASSPINLFSIYPNPFNSGFKIAFTATRDADATFMLMNSNGSKIAEHKIQAQSGYNTYEYKQENELSPGIYFGYLMVGETKLSQQILKQ